LSKEPTQTILCEPEEIKNSCGIEIVELKIEISGEVVYLRIGIEDKQARLSDIVPLARTISDKLVLTVSDELSKKGQSIACCKGCSACCSYLVPLSAPEAFRLREELLSLPVNSSNRILNSCFDTAERILDNRHPRLSLQNSSNSDQSQTSLISKWYSGLKLACPFLSDGLCMLYEQRPLACREHIASGSAVLCQTSHKGDPNVVPMPVSTLEALGQLAAELEQTDIDAVMLPFAFAWAQDNLQRAKRTWSLVTIVKRFVEILEQTASKNAAKSTLSA
jgi:Fe-S-cluster containining protein/uncharacterized protein (DUF1778 family)